MPKTFRPEEVRRTSVVLALLSSSALLLASTASRAAVGSTPKSPAPAFKSAQKNQGQPARKGQAAAAPRVPEATLLQIIEAEDERRWDDADLGKLLTDANPSVRRRAALAAGRIGDEGAVAPLSAMLRADRDEAARAMAAFALGEIESESGADALVEVLRLSKATEVRARAVEALGKIAAALPDARQDSKKRLGVAIADALASEGRLSKPNRALVLLGLTAMLRAKPENGARTVALFLNSSDARVRADAANALARLRAKESLERLRAMLSSDADAVARANAARALGAADDAAAFDALALHAATDADSRVRVSAVRSLAQLKNARASDVLVRRGEELLIAYRSARAGGASNPTEANELLEVATALGRALQNSNDERATALLRQARDAGLIAPEVETALARVAPAQYLRDRSVADFVSRVTSFKDPSITWQKVSAVGQGLGEMANVTSAQVGNSVVGLQADAQIALRSLVQSENTPALAVPDLLRALQAFKPADLAALAREELKADDLIVRATAAAILSEMPPDAANSPRP